MKNWEINSIGSQQWSNENERALQLLSHIRLKRETFMLVSFLHTIFRLFDKLLRYFAGFAVPNWFLRIPQWTLSCLLFIETPCRVPCIHKFMWLLEWNCNKYFTLRFYKFLALSELFPNITMCEITDISEKCNKTFQMKVLSEKLLSMCSTIETELKQVLPFSGLASIHVRFLVELDCWVKETTRVW